MQKNQLTPKEKFDNFIKILNYDLDQFVYVYIMQDYVKENNCRDLLELGVRGGFSTLGLLYACEAYDARLWSMDNATKESDQFGFDEVTRTQNAIKNSGLEKYWAFTQCNDLNYECNKEYDLIFIDTSHAYKQTLLELDKFSKYIKVGKTIFLHDTLHQNHCIDVTGAVAKFMSNDFIRNHLKVRGRWT